jgi:hypothetical protein
MNKKIKVSNLVLALSIVALPFASIANAGDVNACGKPMNTAMKIQKTLDYQDIINVTSTHEYYHGALMHQAELENSWSKREDVSWTNNTDKYNNRKSLWAFYVQNLKNVPKKGALWWHELSTPYIEIAGDGKTAKAIFMSTGSVSGEMEPGKASSQWTQEKYAMDLIKEDGKWKIWHLRTYVDYYTDTNKTWTDLKSNIAAIDTTELAKQVNPDGTFKAGIEKEAGSTFYGVKPDEKKVFYPGYTTERDAQYNPAIPAPYCTFSEVEPY